MAAAIQHYRLSLLGQDLTETLEELIANQMLKEDLKELVMEHFSRAMAEALGTQVRSKASIKGVIMHYRNHDDIWTFFLKPMEMKIDGKIVSTAQKTEMIAVTKR